MPYPIQFRCIYLFVFTYASTINNEPKCLNESMPEEEEEVRGVGELKGRSSPLTRASGGDQA